MMKTSKVLFVFLIGFGLGGTAAADGDSEEWKAAESAESEEAAAPVSSAAQVQGAAAAIDKRLPPVLPGELVSDGEEKLKVWSTAGPVPVAQPPEPWRGKGERPKLPAGVIVDRRLRQQTQTGQRRSISDKASGGTERQSDSAKLKAADK